MSKKNFLSSKNRNFLKNFLESRFSLSEMKGIAFEINVPQESIPQDTLPNFVRELILECERKGLLEKLIETALNYREDEELSKLLTQVISPEESEEWKYALKTYLSKMHERYNKLILLGSPEPAPLEGVFTDVCLLDKLTAEQRADFINVGREMESLERNAERENAVAFVSNPKVKHVMILGKPGAGKTTFLKHLVMLATDGQIDKVPIFVTLKQWSDKESSFSVKGLLLFMAEQFDICGFPDADLFIEYILQEGQALVLLDGLDEINQQDENGKELRNKAIKTIEDFAVKFDQSKCVMTCRVAANEYRFLDFKYAEVANFTPEQVNAFADKWFRNDLKLRDSFKSELNKSVNRGLRNLTTSPILLSLVCLAYQETREFPPGRRVEIYKQAVDALMRKWDVSRDIKRDSVYKGLSQGQKENLIAYVAAQTFGDGDIFIKRASLAELVQTYLRKLARNQPEPSDGDVVLRAVEAQHGIWVERARDIYAFSHLSLQEYFAAEYVKNFAGSGALRQLLTPQHVSDDRWREVILNTANLLGDADDFFDLFEQAINFLEIQSPEIKRFFNWISNKKYFFDIERQKITNLSVALELIASSYGVVGDSCTKKSFEVDIERVRALDLNLSLYRARVFDRNYSQLLDNALSQVLMLSLSPNSDLLMKLALDLYGGILANVAESIAILSNRNNSLLAFNKLWADVIKRTTRSGQSKLEIKLRELEIPPVNYTESKWLDFANITRALINQHLDVGYKWNFSEEDYKTLGNIFSAAKLMLECLEVATVSPEVRQRVRDNILTIDDE
ncbi:MAG TPA: NACHT domain-containing protein [Thermoflexales bacterium]|nr:NACHT domain-containing protein [Thermoflexales bacterium]HQW34670.1 NACHT domain-containing protein [Thermoflexales bacterium]